MWVLLLCDRQCPIGLLASRPLYCNGLPMNRQACHPLGGACILVEIVHRTILAKVLRGSVTASALLATRSR
jgi:hypothetical protein